MTRLNPDLPPPVVEDERLYGLARSIGLREWHTNPTIRTNFEAYFAGQQERLLREAAALPPLDGYPKHKGRIEQ